MTGPIKHKQCKHGPSIVRNVAFGNQENMSCKCIVPLCSSRAWKHKALVFYLFRRRMLNFLRHGKDEPEMFSPALVAHSSGKKVIKCAVHILDVTEN